MMVGLGGSKLNPAKYTIRNTVQLFVLCLDMIEREEIALGSLFLNRRKRRFENHKKKSAPNAFISVSKKRKKTPINCLYNSPKSSRHQDSLTLFKNFGGSTRERMGKM